MQPVLYWYVLYAFWDLLDKVQQILGFMVAIREAIYFILTIIALFVGPVFLMPDIKATWTELFDLDHQLDGKILVIMYVIAPEKYVFTYIGRYIIFIFILILMDMCGFVALIWAISIKNIYIPLIIGYTITTIGGTIILFMAFLGCFIGCCLKCCEKYSDYKRKKEIDSLWLK